MSKVFGASNAAPKVFKANKVIVTINNVNLIAMGVTIQFQRDVTPVPVLGDRRVISIGEPVGQMSAQSFLSKDGSVFQAFDIVGEGGCGGFSATLDFSKSKDACDLAGMKVTLKNCYASAVSIEAQGGRGYIANGVNVTFLGMEVI